MLYYTGLLFLVIAVSLDGFGVGVSYGMRKILVPRNALSIIMLCSGVVVLFSMLLGNVISSYLSIHFAKTIGAAILIFIGVFSLINAIRSQLKKDDGKTNQASSPNNFHRFRTVIATPDKADLDLSGTISIGEAVLLGTALALDAFGAGIGAAILGYSVILTPLLIALMSGLFVHFGIRIGIVLSKNKRLERMNFLPPVLLITIGVLNLF
ncbi:sporulation membrane protein YtaF [Ornithinibacillus bavariensis]|nr:sporulation membrane protein YtaF [Ornithinibacillus sp.]